MYKIISALSISRGCYEFTLMLSPLLQHRAQQKRKGEKFIRKEKNNNSQFNWTLIGIDFKQIYHISILVEAGSRDAPVCVSSTGSMEYLGKQDEASLAPQILHCKKNLQINLKHPQCHPFYPKSNSFLFVTSKKKTKAILGWGAYRANIAPHGKTKIDVVNITFDFFSTTWYSWGVSASPE